MCVPVGTGQSRGSSRLNKVQRNCQLFNRDTSNAIVNALRYSQTCTEQWTEEVNACSSKGFDTLTFLGRDLAHLMLFRHRKYTLLFRPDLS